MSKAIKNKNILISGFYGFGNAGDEAILYSMVSSFKKEMPDIAISVLSHKEITELKPFGVKFINRKNYFEIIAAMLKTSLFISGGGGLIQDITSVRSIKYYLGLINLAKLLGKKVLIYAQGIGPVITEEGKKRTKDTLNKVDSITIRDEYSKWLLGSLGVKQNNIEVTADPVLTLSGDADITDLCQKYGILPADINLGISIRPWRTDCTDALAEFLTELNKNRPDIKQYLLPFQLSQDLAECARLEKKLNHKVAIINEQLSTLQLLTLISKFNYIIAMRLHAAIMASVKNIPALGIVYDPKVKNFFSLTDLPSVELEEVSADLLKTNFDYIIKNEQDIKIKLKNNIEGLKTKADKNVEIVKQLLK